MIKGVIITNEHWKTVWDFIRFSKASNNSWLYFLSKTPLLPSQVRDALVQLEARNLQLTTCIACITSMVGADKAEKMGVPDEFIERKRRSDKVGEEFPTLTLEYEFGTDEYRAGVDRRCGIPVGSIPRRHK